MGTVCAELKSERLIVSAVTPAGPDNLGGMPIDNPVKVCAHAGMNQGASSRAMVLGESRDWLTNGSFLRPLFTIAAIALGVAAPSWASAFCLRWSTLAR